MRKKNFKLLFLLGTISVSMLCLAYASVPLYSLFCKTTGFGGTPKRAAYTHYVPVPRVITVRFNADISADLGWKFYPSIKSIKTPLGANVLSFYTIENLTDKSSRGIAIYNIAPEKAAKYFNKVACFCYEEQQVAPKQKMIVPVSFFIDPALALDNELQNLNTITLSYTFFKYNK